MHRAANSVLYRHAARPASRAARGDSHGARSLRQLAEVNVRRPLAGEVGGVPGYGNDRSLDQAIGPLQTTVVV